MTRLQNKRVMVTGASWGIGRAVAIHLARHGCRVVATSRREELLKETIEAVKKCDSDAQYFIADISKNEDILSLRDFVEKKWGGLDFLINVAFGSLETPLEESESEDISSFIQTSVTGTMLVTKHLMTLFPEGEGHIVNIIADWGLPMHNLMTAPMSPYITAKHAISGFTQTLRRELADTGRQKLKITGIYPGATAAVDLENGISFSIDDPVEEAGDSIALIDVARSVEFVLSQSHSTITHLVIAPPDNSYNGL